MRYIAVIILCLIFLKSLAQEVKVVRVIDGDTFVIESGERVRLIGINAPEISDIFGDEAKGHLEQIIGDKKVLLVRDNISNDRDRYSRLLRYVFVDKYDINLKMIADGYAIAYLKYHFNKKKEYKLAQLEAQSNAFGMWHPPTVSNGKKTIDSSVSSQHSFTILHSGKAMFIYGLIILLVIMGIFYSIKK